MIDKTTAKKIKKLYSEGWNDAEIIRRGNVNGKQVADWRKENGNLKPNKKQTIQACEALYAKGMVDGDIGRAVGIEEGAVFQWRKRNTLPPNGEPGGARRRRESLDMLWADIEEYYFAGLSDDEIAKKMHIIPYIVARWRKIMCLPEVWDVKKVIQKDAESLFCDREFLEEICRKPIKPC